MFLGTNNIVQSAVPKRLQSLLIHQTFSRAMHTRLVYSLNIFREEQFVNLIRQFPLIFPLTNISSITALLWNLASYLQSEATRPLAALNALVVTTQVRSAQNTCSRPLLMF